MSGAAGDLGVGGTFGGDFSLFEGLSGFVGVELLSCNRAVADGLPWAGIFLSSKGELAVASPTLRRISYRSGPTVV